MSKSKAMTALAILLLASMSPAQANVITDQSRISVSIPQIPSAVLVTQPTPINDPSG